MSKGVTLKFYMETTEPNEWPVVANIVVYSAWHRFYILEMHRDSYKIVRMKLQDKHRGELASWHEQPV